jgi:hypothetical protein
LLSEDGVDHLRDEELLGLGELGDGVDLQVKARSGTTLAAGAAAWCVLAEHHIERNRLLQ